MKIYNSEMNNYNLCLRLPVTETVKEYEASFPAASSTVYFTVVLPMLNCEPEL